MPAYIRDEVYRRIVLAKMLHQYGVDACSNQVDQMLFTKGIFLLHDAAEAALGAIADHLHAQLPDNCYLLQYYDLINKADEQKRAVPYRHQMRSLNTLRKIAKHQGILPDIKSNAHFPATTYAFLCDITKTYLDIDFQSVSLKSLIRNSRVLKCIDQAEKEIAEEHFEEALISLAYAMYYICDESTIPWLFLSSSDAKKPYLFTKTYTTEHTVKLTLPPKTGQFTS